MAESHELCTYYRFHQHKIVLFLAAMRRYAEELREAGHLVHYQKLEPRSKTTPYESLLQQWIRKNRIQRLRVFEIEDKFMETRIRKLATDLKIELIELKSPSFLTTREEFRDWVAKRKPFMKTFYESQRRKHKILLTKEGKPLGGQYSFDTENRKPLPKDLTKFKIPSIPSIQPDEVVTEVIELVQGMFSEHPGKAHEFWLPTSRKQAVDWLKDFCKKRLENFGPYEDALHSEQTFMFHSVLSPLINMGLLTPQQILQTALNYAEKNDVPLNSLEGFVRQVMGWREFIRGIYQNYSDQQESRNFFGHNRKMKDTWQKGQTGNPALDHALNRVERWGWCHHIERLMVIGNLMNLSEIRPGDAHSFFMERFVDSSDWVMGPNVYGMALFSDGGIFATKPYICGSNYILKMSAYTRGPWCDEMDGLYWRFVDQKRDFLGKNPRLRFIVNTYDKMTSEKRDRLTRAAKTWMDRNTVKA